jgi:putative ABC transport system permease protein
MENLFHDLRYGVRMLSKSPAFTAVAIVTLALGIGANTAIFSVVNAVLLRQLPYADSERLVAVWERNLPRGRVKNSISPANFLDWRAQNNSFEQMAGLFDFRLNLTGFDDPEELATQVVTPNFFDVLGSPALIGRTFVPEEGEQGHDPVAVLSYGLWQRRFGGDPGIVGKTITLNGRSNEVIGVMPAGVQFVLKFGSNVGKQPDIWVPMTFGPNSRVRTGRYMLAIARLKSGITVQQAQAEMDALGESLEQQYPDFNKGWGIRVSPLRDEFVGEIRPALLLLFGAVGFVLLIACANVANLLLARGASRQKEMAIRTALGAARGRIIRQVLTESCVMGLVGGTLGLLLAVWGIDVLLSFAPKDLIRPEGIAVSWRVMGFTTVVALLTGLVFGLFPALEASQPDLNESLKEGGRSGGGSVRGARLRNVFVVAEVAIALVLLIGAGLMIRSFAKLQSVDPGFDASNVLAVKLLLPTSKYREAHLFFDALLGRIESLPGVRSAGAINFLPFGGAGAATGFTIEGRPQLPSAEQPTVDSRVVQPGYFKTMGVPFISGRNFTEQEETKESHVVIINEMMARTYFPDEDPIGKRVTIEMKDDNKPSEIIGIVQDVKHDKLDSEVRAMAYWPQAELSYPFMTLVIRTDSNPLALTPAIRHEVKLMDADLPISDVTTMEQLIGASVAKTRFSTLLLGVFGGIAMLLAAVGIYGVMSYSVTQRTHEIGIRMALGASTGDVLRNVLGGGMLLIAIAVCIGLVSSFALTRLMTTLLYGVTPTDPFTFGAISVLLMGVALVANYIPARRALKVDPMVALRYE